MGEIFTATWLDGERKLVRVNEGENRVNYIKWRSLSLTVSLEVIINSTKIDHAFINEVII